MNLFLIGFRGTGKTSVGRALSRHLNWSFVDMDDILAAEAGHSIADMVRDHGWAYFREQERRLLRRLAAGRRQVVGTGGGVILLPENVAALRSSGTVVWLRAGGDTIKHRLARDPRSAAFRPSLTAGGAADEIDALLAARAPLYQSAMHLAVDTDDRSVAELCERIIQELDRIGFDLQGSIGFRTDPK